LLSQVAEAVYRKSSSTRPSAVADLFLSDFKQVQTSAANDGSYNSQRIAKLPATYCSIQATFRATSRTSHYPEGAVELELPGFRTRQSISLRATCAKRDAQCLSLAAAAQLCFSRSTANPSRAWRQWRTGARFCGKTCATRNSKTPMFRYQPVAFTGEEEFPSFRLFLKALRKSIVDVIVVDGTEWTGQLRPICFRAAEEKSHPAASIVWTIRGAIASCGRRIARTVSTFSKA